MRQASGRNRHSTAKKKTTKRKSTSVPTAYKRTLLIDSAKLRGDSFKVGKNATVEVSGKIVEESLRDYETKGRKSFRLEISKIIAKKTVRKG